MGAHSPWAPSSLHHIEQCPGSPQMQAGYPEPEGGERSIAAAEGTAAHWAVQELMEGRLPMPGDRAENGILLTDEMIEAADLMVADVTALITPHGLKLKDCIAEQPVSITRIHADCWGTPDVRVWLPGKHIVVWDFKFGHRNVPVFENRQLIAYSIGAITTAGLHDTEVRVTNRIVQPRSYSSDGPVRSWSYGAAEVRGIVNLLNMAVTEAAGPNPRTRVGPACRDCRAAHACPTLQRAAEDAMDTAGSAMPQELSGAAMGVELRYVSRALALLEARRDALREQATSMIRSGARVPHWGVVQSAGRQGWTKPAAEVIAMGAMLGISLAKPPEPVTPVQAVKAGLPESLLTTFAERKSGALTLTLDDGSMARKIFGGNA